MRLLERPAAEDAWLAVPLAVAPGVRRLEVGGRAAVFCEASGRLAELNATADRIWRGLATGRPPAVVSDELERQGAGREEATAFVVESARAWLALGWLWPAVAPDGAFVRLPLRIGDLTASVSLQVAADHPIAAELEAVFGQFAGRAAPDGVSVDVRPFAGGYLLAVDGRPRGLFAADRIVAELKAALTQALADSGAVLLHGGLLTRAGRGLLITGAPGAGKTTLAVALAARGFAYGADDVVQLAADGALAGLRFSPAVKAGAWPLLAPLFEGLLGRPIHRRADGQAVRYLPASGWGAACADTPSWALVLDRRPGAGAALEPVAPLAMLAELLGGAFAADRACGTHVAALAARLGGADCRRLVYSDLTAAAAAIEAWTDG